MERVKEKTVIKSGGRNSANYLAKELEPIAKNVFITCRNNNFTCHESQATQLKNSSVVCFFHTSITKMIASKGQETSEKVELSNQESGGISYLENGEVCVKHGYEGDVTWVER